MVERESSQVDLMEYLNLKFDQLEDTIKSLGGDMDGLKSKIDNNRDDIAELKTKVSLLDIKSKTFGKILTFIGAAVGGALIAFILKQVGIY